MEYCVEAIGRDTLLFCRQFYKKFFSWMKYFVSLLYGGCILASWLNSDDLYYKICYTAVLSLMGILVYCAIPRWVANVTYRSRLRYYDGATPELTARFGDQILLEDIDSSRTISYDKIKKIYFLPDGLAVMLRGYQMIGIPIKNFTKGSAEEMKQLFREKRPDLKIPE